MTASVKNIASDINAFLWGKLYSLETGLFYDRIQPGNDPFSDLPDLSEIANQFPNPGGWGTGMEDSSINAGHMLECLALEHLLYGTEIFRKAKNVLRGIRLCESVHGKNGFLVRSVSHRDGRSCYINSSRDQLTMIAAGMYDLYRLVPGLPEDERALIRTILSEIAAYCIRTVTPENNYSYLRLDGGRALVSTLWKCDVHEMLRLPMIYGAAWECCREERFLSEALEYMEEGIRVSENFDENKYYWDFPLVQMQLSLDVLRNCPALAEFHGTLEVLMDRVAFAACREFLRILELCENYEGDWYVYNSGWRQLPMRIMGDSLKQSGGSAVLDGCTFLNPVYDEGFFRIVELQRSLGNYLIAALLAPRTPLKCAEYERFLDFAVSLDYSKTTHAGPFSLLHGMLLGEQRFR